MGVGAPAICVPVLPRTCVYHAALRDPAHICIRLAALPSFALSGLLGVTQEAYEALVQAGQGASLEQLQSLYPFAWDEFQTEAVSRLLAGGSVVVCAPTSAGKTLVAEAACVAMLATGKKLIYTTPLKALSNQKKLELQVCVR